MAIDVAIAAADVDAALGLVNAGRNGQCIARFKAQEQPGRVLRQHGHGAARAGEEEETGDALSPLLKRRRRLGRFEIERWSSPDGAPDRTPKRSNTRDIATVSLI